MTRRLALGGKQLAAATTLNPFTQLPPELSFHIISFLSYQDTLRLTQTSKAGYEYGNDDMVWKNLIHTELGVSFLDGCELAFDEHMERRQSAGGCCKGKHTAQPSAAAAAATSNNNDDEGRDMMEIDNQQPEGKTWKERFQHLLAMRTDLSPVHYRSMKSVRLPAMVEPEPSPCGGNDCSGKCGASQAPSNLGCKHYRRDCKLLAACCGRFFVCRHCHDESVHDHRIDRYATQLVLCMACNAIQPAGQHCTSPQCQDRSLGSYFCGTCKFYDNDPEKAIFHCEFCQVCKLGKKSESFHCHACGRCFSKAVMATHPCLNKRQQTVNDER
jgi:hypothetical protein